MGKSKPLPKQKPKINQTKWILGLLVALLITIVLLIIINPGQNDQFKREVSVEEAAQMRNDGAFILDVREPEEWITAHIPGATLIPLGELKTRATEVPSDETIIVVCRSGNRSAEGRDVLRKAGFLKVTSMAGGINDWIERGYPTVSGP